MEDKIKVGDVVYLAGWSGPVAYTVGSIVTKESGYGTSVEMRADSKGNNNYLNPTDTFRTEKEAREHIIKMIKDSYDEQMLTAEEAPVETKYI